MARVQTRRTISFSAAMIPAVQEAARVAGVSSSQYAHEALAARLRADGHAAPEYRPPSAASPATLLRRAWGKTLRRGLKGHYRCSVCGELGHNKQNKRLCKGAP